MADINISKLKLPNDNNTYHFKDTVSGYTNNTGTVTSITAGTGLTGSTITTSGTLSHADTSSQASVSNSGRTYIQSVTLDSMGHVTGLTSATETVTNTDTKVRQTLKSDNVNRPLLMSYTNNTSTTGNIDNVSYRANAIYANASSGEIHATGFIGPASQVALNSFGTTFTGNILATNNSTTDSKVYNGSDFLLSSTTSADSNQGQTTLYIGNSLHAGYIVLNTGPDLFTPGLDREVVIHPPMTGAITEPAVIELTLPSTSGTLINSNYSLAAGESFGGAAVAAAKLKNDVTVGASYNPVYFYQGLPVAGKYSFDSGNIASKGTATITGIQRGLIIISRGTAGAGVYFIDHWYGVATAVNNANFTVTCSNGTATLKNNHASLQATYFAIYYTQ